MAYVYNFASRPAFVFVAFLIILMVTAPASRRREVDPAKPTTTPAPRPPEGPPQPPPAPSRPVPKPSPGPPVNTGPGLAPAPGEDDAPSVLTTVLFAIVILVVTMVAATMSAKKRGEGDFAPDPTGLRYWKFLPNPHVPMNSYMAWDSGTEPAHPYRNRKGAEMAASFAGWNGLAKPGPGGKEPKSQIELEDEHLAAESMRASKAYRAEKARREQQQQNIYFGGQQDVWQ